MIKITKNSQVLLYAVAATLVAVILTVLLIASVHPPQVLEYTLFRAPATTAVVVFPMMLFAGMKIKEVNNLAEVLQRSVSHDHLTGVASREHFFSQLTDNAKAQGVSLMVDIDHFKDINETHGHSVGDAVLAKVADLLTKECREHDIVCRYGGEEFAIFLNQSNPEVGLIVAERMREKIAEHNFGTEHDPLNITVSIGMSNKADREPIDDVLKVADRALYTAKARGRNRIVTVGGVPQAA